MADDGLIGAYLRELRFSLGSLSDADDMIVEAEDHLRQATERLIVTGSSPTEAEAEAVARFGSATLVARVSAIEAKRGAAVPTNLTRRSGLAAMLTPVLLILGQSINTRVPVDRGAIHGIGVLLLTAAIPAFVFGLWGLRARHGGLGRLGKWAIVAAVLAPFGSFVAGYYGLFAGIGLLCLAVVVLVVEMLRANVLPVVPLVLVAVGPIATLGVMAGITATGGDAGDTRLVFAPALLSVIGYVTLGWHLWREPARNAAHQREPLATA